MDNVTLGRTGEHFVLDTLFNKGWYISFCNNDNLKHTDWILEKNNKRISIQIKTCSDKHLLFGMNKKKPYDYLIVTNLVDMWIVPSFTIGHINRINYKREHLLRNRFELLELDKNTTIIALMDLGFRPSQIVT